MGEIQYAGTISCQYSILIEAGLIMCLFIYFERKDKLFHLKSNSNKCYSLLQTYF